MEVGQTKYPAVYSFLITHWSLTISLRQANWSNLTQTHVRAPKHTHNHGCILPTWGIEELMDNGPKFNFVQTHSIENY